MKNLISFLKNRFGPRVNLELSTDIPEYETEAFGRKQFLRLHVFQIETIKELIELANEVSDNSELAFAITPISSGKNWGYGTQTPIEGDKNVVILDLSNFNKIKYFDSENGIVTLEPGVTQQQLHDYLESTKAPYIVPVTGAGPTVSIVGNALERGYGITPIADHFSAVTSIKGYLGDGSFFESSLKAMSDQHQNSKEGCYVDKTYKWKQGPYLEGLFTQSGNLIATEATIILARQKEYFSSFYMRFYQKESFSDAYAITKDIFRELEGVVGSINLMDKRRVAAMVAANPNGPESHDCMTDEQVNHISKSYDVPEWTLVGTLYGTKRVVKAAKKDIQKLIKGRVDQPLFSDSLIVKLGSIITKSSNNKLLAAAKEQLAKLAEGTKVMKGIPTEVALPLAYWRHHKSRSELPKSTYLDPARDKCGLLWYAPLIPATTTKMKDFIDMVRRVTPRFNIEPMITFTNLSGVATDSTIPIVFDRMNPQAVQDAHNCLKMLFEEGIKQGFIPYRLNINQQRSLDPNSVFWTTAGKISHVLDPNGVLNPHRYNPYVP